jgi:hypothetical protein
MQRSLAHLANVAQANDLPRLICLVCSGFGGSPMQQTCGYCQSDPAGWCRQHRCEGCFGRGVVCPECRGMRYLSGGVGQMTAHLTSKDGAIMHNSALQVCPKCMTLQDEVLRLNMAEETKVIHAYIADPHGPYWRIRDRMDADHAAWQATITEAKLWRQDFTTHRQAAKQQRNAAAEALLDAIVLPDNVSRFRRSALLRGDESRRGQAPRAT